MLNRLGSRYKNAVGVFADLDANITAMGTALQKSLWKDGNSVFNLVSW